MARGSIIKRGGGYCYRVDLGPDPATGKRRQRSKQGFHTKHEPEAALQEELERIARGAAVNLSSDELGPYLAEWLETQRHNLKETTWSSYRVAVDPIASRIDRRRLEALTPLKIERFYGDLAEPDDKGKALSAKTTRNTHVALHNALTDAERLGLVPRNAAPAANPPSVKPVEHSTWDSDQPAHFFEHVADDRLLAAYVLAATAGMRRGEVLGLRWSDVDLDAGELAVRQTITTVNYQPVVTTPKTKRSQRMIYLDEHTWMRYELTAAGSTSSSEPPVASGTTTSIWCCGMSSATSSTPTGSRGSSPDR